jgi:hypothetical protein
MGPIVSQQSTDVCSVLFAPLHIETDSIQKDYFMFCHLLFPIWYLGLYHPLFYHCFLWVLNVTYVLSLFWGLMNVYWVCLRHQTMSNIILLKWEGLSGFACGKRVNGVSDCSVWRTKCILLLLLLLLLFIQVIQKHAMVRLIPYRGCRWFVRSRNICDKQCGNEQLCGFFLYNVNDVLFRQYIHWQLNILYPTCNSRVREGLRGGGLEGRKRRRKRRRRRWWLYEKLYCMSK